MSASASCYSCASVDRIWIEKTLDMPFLAYYGCSKPLKARAVFYWGTHTRFTVRVGIDLSLTKTRRTRIVYLAVRETEYFTEILRNIPRMREQWCPGRFFPPPQKRPGNEARASAHLVPSRTTGTIFHRPAVSPDTVSLLNVSPRFYLGVRRGRLRIKFFSCSSMAWIYLILQELLTLLLTRATQTRPILHDG